MKTEEIEMDEKTRAHFIAQMVKTQNEFDKLKAMVMDTPAEETISEEVVTMQEIDETPIQEQPVHERPGGHEFICGCGKKDTVPFKPKYQTTLYCRECYKKRG